MRLLVLVIATLLAACGDRESIERHAAESACYSAELSSFRTDRKSIEERYKAARSAKESTVEIVIDRQRRIERFCLASAKCYPGNDAALSNLFEWCVDDERE